MEVYFDDFKITQVKSPVVSVDDYYPFGLTFNSYKRESTVINRIKFQGQEHVDDLGLNWDSFKWRNHQPDIGRFFNVDPLAEKYYYNSPYAFSENKVVAHRELEGLEAESIVKNEIKKVEGVWNNLVNKVEKVVDKVTNALTLGHEATGKQQKGMGVNLYGESKGPDNKYVPAPDPKAKNVNLEKSVLDGVSIMTKSLKVPTASDIGESAKNVATGIDKAAKAVKAGQNDSPNKAVLDTVGTTGNVGRNGETYNSYYVIQNGQDTIDDRHYVPDNLMPKTAK